MSLGMSYQIDEEASIAMLTSGVFDVFRKPRIAVSNRSSRDVYISLRPVSSGTATAPSFKVIFLGCGIGFSLGSTYFVQDVGQCLYLHKGQESKIYAPNRDGMILTVWTVDPGTNQPTQAPVLNRMIPNQQIFILQDRHLPVCCMFFLLELKFLFQH